MRGSDLRVREVVNVVDGRRLGVMADFEVDLETGRLLSIIVPGPGRFFGLLGREGDWVIPWDRIKKIGSDVILVDLPNYAEPKTRLL